LTAGGIRQSTGFAFSKALDEYLLTTRLGFQPAMPIEVKAVSDGE
jgi:hypothetical protein